MGDAGPSRPWLGLVFLSSAFLLQVPVEVVAKGTRGLVRFFQARQVPSSPGPERAWRPDLARKEEPPAGARPEGTRARGAGRGAVPGDRGVRPNRPDSAIWTSAQDSV